MSQPSSDVKPAKSASKKDQVLALFAAGISEVEDLAMITQSRPSYVAGVLEEARKLPGYFDLYTSTAKPMNVYSKYFAGKLGFKDEATARNSVKLLEQYYRGFELAGDRAGQHHALMLALMMFDRARWTGKEPEAAVFRDWLVGRLTEEARPTAPRAPGRKTQR